MRVVASARAWGPGGWRRCTRRGLRRPGCSCPHTRPCRSTGPGCRPVPVGPTVPSTRADPVRGSRGGAGTRLASASPMAARSNSSRLPTVSWLAPENASADVLGRSSATTRPARDHSPHRRCPPPAQPGKARLARAPRPRRADPPFRSNRPSGRPSRCDPGRRRRCSQVSGSQSPRQGASGVAARSASPALDPPTAHRIWRLRKNGGDYTERTYA